MDGDEEETMLSNNEPKDKSHWFFRFAFETIQSIIILFFIAIIGGIGLWLFNHGLNDISDFVFRVFRFIWFGRNG